METAREIVRVGIWTPYLIEDMSKECDDEYVAQQIKMFGYDPNKLIKEDKLVTGRNVVLLEKKDSSLKRPHLVIVGCTRSVEDSVKRTRGTGVLVARYSTFYGEPSDYTGNYPDQCGYALDIPKDPDVVKALLHCDDVLEALVAREEERIRCTLDCFNAARERPVLVTGYLREALALP